MLGWVELGQKKMNPRSYMSRKKGRPQGHDGCSSGPVVFTARRYALSAVLAVDRSLSVRLSVTLVCCGQTSSRPGSPSFYFFEPKHRYTIRAGTSSTGAWYKLEF